MAYESSKTSTKNQAQKVGASAKSSAKLAATSGDTKSGMPTMAGSEQTFHECDAVEAELAALKVSYEHYFLGADRVPPTRQHEDLKKRVEKLKSSFVRNTSAKFRVQSIHGKFTTYDRLWQRTMQEIENGTYKRDVAKARRRIDTAKKPAARGTAPVELAEDDLDEVVSREAPRLPQPHHQPVPAVAPVVAPSVAPMVPAVAAMPSVAPLIPAVRPVAPVAARPPAVAARPPAAAVRPAAAASSSELSDDKLKTVYEAYVSAKRRNKEDTSKMSYDTIAASLRKQVPELMKQHNAKGVEFKVVIKDGKAVLKAVPK